MCGYIFNFVIQSEKKVAHNQTCEVEGSYFRGKETGVDQREGRGGVRGASMRAYQSSDLFL